MYCSTLCIVGGGGGSLCFVTLRNTDRVAKHAASKKQKYYTLKQLERSHTKI